jgi:hypothetical protein
MKDSLELLGQGSCGVVHRLTNLGSRNGGEKLGWCERADLMPRLAGAGAGGGGEGSSACGGRALRRERRRRRLLLPPAMEPRTRYARVPVSVAPPCVGEGTDAAVRCSPVDACVRPSRGGDRYATPFYLGWADSWA